MQLQGYGIGTFQTFIVVIGVGLLGVLIYALQATGLASFGGVLSVGLMLAGASLLAGGLLGFLFGIPRTRSVELADETLPAGEQSYSNTILKREPQYQANTNLEQISDWLTKILVGVGLVQINEIAAGVLAVADYAAPGLGGFASSSIFALTIMIYFTICGFLLGYLWTRLSLAGALQEADQALIEKQVEVAALLSMAEIQKEDLSELETQLPDQEKARSIANMVSQVVTRKATQQLAQAAVLWVDAHPNNNLFERQSMEALGIRFTLSPSHIDALQKLRLSPYQLVISDIGSSPGDKTAYILLEEIRRESIKVPVIIYMSTARPEEVHSGNEVDPRQQGAFGVTSRPQELVQLVMKALQSTGPIR